MNPSITRIATEAQEQTALMQWVAAKTATHPALAGLFAIPNGGSRKSAAEGAHLKAQGVRRGVADLFLPVPRRRYHGLFLEMKRIKGGVLSPEQFAFGQSVMAHGYRYAVCKGWESAADVLLQYLSLPGNET